MRKQISDYESNEAITMKTKDHFLSASKHKKLKLVRMMLAEKIGKEKTALAFKNADQIYYQLTEEWDHIPEAEKKHTEGFMFPNIALYKAMEEYISSLEAEKIIEQSTLGFAEPVGRMLDKITRIPGFSSLFMKVFAKMIDTSYGEKEGFQSRFYVRNKDELSFDILQCPYQKYYTLIGYPQLCKYNCLSDDACYGHMKKIQFVRTKTLGRGNDMCYFRFKKIK